MWRTDNDAGGTDRRSERNSADAFIQSLSRRFPRCKLGQRRLYYTIFLCYLDWEIYDQNRNPNINNREHLVGRPTMPHPAMKKIYKTTKWHHFHWHHHFHHQYHNCTGQSNQQVNVFHFFVATIKGFFCKRCSLVKVQEISLYESESGHLLRKVIYPSPLESESLDISCDSVPVSSFKWMSSCLPTPS